MKYLKSYKLFEGVTVPDIKTSSDGNDSKGCGTCLAAKSGKPLESSPQETPQSSDDSQNSNKPSSKGQQINPYEAEKRKFFEDNPHAEGCINEVFISAKDWYTGHYMKPETLKKFKNKANRDKLVDFINKEIKLAYWNRNSDSEMFERWEKEYSNALGWVWAYRFQWINLNMENYKDDPDYKQAIPHEIGHCIYFKLIELGENPVSGNEDASTSDSPNFKATGLDSPLSSLSNEERMELEDREDYLTSEPENQTRIMTLRQLWNIGSVDTCEQIKQKFEKNLGNGNLKFDNLIPSGFVKNKNGDCYWLKLKVPQKYIERLLDKKYQLVGYGKKEAKPRLALISELFTCSFDGENKLDFQKLFSIFSQYSNGFIWLDLSGLTQLNLDVVTNDSPDDFNKRG